MIAEAPVPKITTPDGRQRIVLAVDVSNWLRPDAATSPDRAFCHTYAHHRAGQAQMIPGWPYSFVCALEAGATSWTALLEVVRLHPDDDATLVPPTSYEQSSATSKTLGTITLVILTCWWYSMPVMTSPGWPGC